MGNTQFYCSDCYVPRLSVAYVDIRTSFASLCCRANGMGFISCGDNITVERVLKENV